MENENPEVHVISYPEFQINGRTGELFAGAAQVILPPRLTVLFMALAERPGELVTRQELYARLWKGSHAQYGTGLDTAIRSLRRILSLAAVRGVVIETLHRRGYRLLLQSRSDGVWLPQLRVKSGNSMSRRSLRTVGSDKDCAGGPNPAGFVALTPLP
jgi:DNA-binding winged helix-turn-helix (wHTH) protein